MIRKYPQIKGLLDAQVEREFRIFADSLYGLIENLAQKTNVSLEINSPNSPSMIDNSKTSAPKATNSGASGTGLSNDVFSQPVLNQGEVLTSLLNTYVPKSVLKSTLINTPGVFPVAGKITLLTLDGKSVEVLTP